MLPKEVWYINLLIQQIFFNHLQGIVLGTVTYISGQTLILDIKNFFLTKQKQLHSRNQASALVHVILKINGRLIWEFFTYQAILRDGIQMGKGRFNIQHKDVPLLTSKPHDYYFK